MTRISSLDKGYFPLINKCYKDILSFSVDTKVNCESDNYSFKLEQFKLHFKTNMISEQKIELDFNWKK